MLRSHDAREALADFLDASPDEVGFGANMTTLTFHLARALGRAWGAGDEMVVTELDHHANVDAVAARRARSGRDRAAHARCTRDATARLDDLERAITRARGSWPIGAASNALGTVNDVRAAVTLAHDAGALAFVDAVHYAPHRSWTSPRSAAISWRARPTSSTGRTSACSTAQRLLDAFDVPKLDRLRRGARADRDRHSATRASSGPRGGRLPGQPEWARRFPGGIARILRGLARAGSGAHRTPLGRLRGRFAASAGMDRHRRGRERPP